MADLKNRSDGLALALLLVGAARHYGWAMFPQELKALASKGLGGLAMLALLAIIFHMARERGPISKTFGLVFLWSSWEGLQISLCSFWFMVDPWPINAGEAMCSARIGLDIGSVGILAVAVILWRLTRTIVQVTNRLER